jgi:hypothetical protein
LASVDIVIIMISVLQSVTMFTVSTQLMMHHAVCITNRYDASTMYRQAVTGTSTPSQGVAAGASCNKWCKVLPCFLRVGKQQFEIAVAGAQLIRLKQSLLHI